MGKKTNWFVSVKKAFSPVSKEKKDQKTSKSKKKWGFGKSQPLDPSSSSEEKRPAPHAPAEEVKLTGTENEQDSHSYSVAIATAAAAEAAVAAAHAAAEVVRLTSMPRYPGISKEEVAAIKIQTAFRGYLARRALRALRGLVRLKNLVQGNSVKRQATITLRCMQTLAKVQSQIRARRIRMSEENQALQRQLQLKREKELENLKASIGQEWDDSMQSKEDIEASLQHKHEAAIRRERALAYAYTHQQQVKNATRSVQPMFTDPSNPQWGWSWLERWMAARPWETQNATEKDNDSHSSVKSVPRSMVGAVAKSYARRDLINDKVSPGAQKHTRPPSRQSPSTPSKSSPSITAKAKQSTPRSRRSMGLIEDDLRSMGSLQSEKYKRHSIAGSSVRDDESLASSPSVPSYMAVTESAKAKSRLASPLGNNVETPDRASVGSVKKRLSFQPSPGGLRRHSGPPKVDLSSLKDFDEQDEQTLSNGVGIQS